MNTHTSLKIPCLYHCQKCSTAGQHHRCYFSPQAAGRILADILARRSVGYPFVVWSLVVVVYGQRNCRPWLAPSERGGSMTGAIEWGYWAGDCLMALE